jgi:membrane dipeptidase
MATFADYMKHLLHIIKVAGPEHVGLGADWDGGGGVKGMEDIASLPKITERLVQEGYSEAQIDGILGGNLLRLMRQVEAAAGH